MADVTQFELPEGKAVYFASDMHFGTPSHDKSRERENRFVSWLETISHDAQALYLVGDVFDFWMEYRHVVPKGHIRLMGALAKLADSGVQIHCFTGNHDMWMRNYVVEEIGAKIHRGPVRHQWNDLTLYIAHGDGLGPGDYGYKILKRIFAFKPFQWMFRQAPVDLAFFVAKSWSQGSRKRTGDYDKTPTPLSQEPMFQHAKAVHANQPADLYVFGHRHHPQDNTEDGVRFVNLGDWLHHDSWGKLKAGRFELMAKS